MGAATFTETSQDVHGNRRIVRGTLTLSASYATGGDSFNLATEVGLKELHKVLVDSNTRGLSLSLGGTSKVPLLLCYATSGAEVANATDQSALTLSVELHGT
jgi:hypothetical protein